MSLLITALQKAEKSRSENSGRRASDIALEPLDSTDFAPSERTYDPAQAATLLTAGEHLSPVADFVRDHSFGLVLGVLLLAAIGWGAYVWLQIQSPAMFAPKSVSPIAQPAAQPAPPQAPAAQQTAVTQNEPPQTPAQFETSASKPATPDGALAEAPFEEKTESAFEPAVQETRFTEVQRHAPPAEPRVPEVRAPAPSRQPSPQTSPATSPPQAPVQAINVTGTDREIRISQSVEAPVEQSRISQAYAAFQNSDYQQARTLYEEVRKTQPSNTDALLGLAAIASLEGSSTEASQLYFKALEIEPKNAAAQAGVISVLGRADPAASEVRLKSLIEKEPSASLYSVLGNLYAEQSKWAEAQSAYFQAFTLAQGNADYAFNLAISLEHLSQPRPALTYYRKALELGGGRFDRAAVKDRIVRLQSPEK